MDPVTHVERETRGRGVGEFGGSLGEFDPEDGPQIGPTPELPAGVDATQVETRPGEEPFDSDRIVVR